MAQKKNKKQKRNIIIILTIIMIVFLIIGKKAGWFGEDSAYKISTDPVERRTIKEYVSASGKIQPETEIKISPYVSGEIVELAVKEGQQVKKGDFLLKIKPDIYESALERTIAAGNSANANYMNSQARLEQVKAQFQKVDLSYIRNKTLWEQGVISQAEYENALSSYQMAIADLRAAEASVNAAQFQLLSAQATIKEANENLKKTSVFAPMDGIVSILNVEAGERVVGTEMMAGTEMLRIANLNVMQVIVDVNENDIVKIKINDTADINVDAYFKRKFKGVVTEISNSANISGFSTDQVTNFKVKIRILPESYQDLISEHNKYPFRPGMTASVDIYTNSVSDALAVPLSAITTRIEKESFSDSENKGNDNPNDYNEIVFVYKDGKAIQRKVKIGIQDSYYIQIIEGLQEGEEVITAPYSLISKILRDGMTVKKVSREEVYSESKNKK
jgi:HlyD family secretion protein